MSPASILIVGHGAVLLLPVAWRVVRRTFDPFEPFFLFALVWGVLFVVRPAAMLVRGDLASYNVDISGTLSRAILLGFMGGVAFIVGYELRAGHIVAGRLPAPQKIGARLGLMSAVVITGFALLALVVFLRGFSNFGVLLGGRNAELRHLLENSSTYVWNASMLLVPAALLLIALALRDRSMLLGLAAASVLCLALYRTVPVGSRLFLLPLLGGLFVFVYVRRAARPGLPMLATGLAFAVVASFTILYYRDPESRSGAVPAIESLAKHPGRVFRPLVRGQDAEMAPLLAASLRAIPGQLGYRYGLATIGDFVTRPIPRQLWRGKPRTPSQQIVDAVWPPSSVPYLNPAFPPIVFFYWDFWIPGVIGGMAIFGIAARALYEWFLRYPGELVAQVIFSLALWFVVIGSRNDPVDTVVIAAFVVLPLIVVNWVAGARTRALTSFGPQPARPSQDATRDRMEVS